MAAFAKVKLTQEGRYEDTDYAEGDVLRLPSDLAARLVKRGRAEPYDGTAHPKNVPKDEPEAAPKRSRRKAAEPETEAAPAQEAE